MQEYDKSVRAADVLLSTRQVTAKFGVTVVQLDRWARSGLLYVDRSGRERRFREAQVCALLQSGGAR